MHLTYRLAAQSDLDTICDLVGRSINSMINNGIYQWDELYPTYDDFKCDIENRQLYVGIAENKIVVIFVINREYDPEYDNASWNYTGDRFAVVHRVCVDTDFQHKGIAKNALLFIEQLLISQGIQSIRLDVFSQNPYALKLYSNLGYTVAGYADFRKGIFVLMEKHI